MYLTHPTNRLRKPGASGASGRNVEVGGERAGRACWRAGVRVQAATRGAGRGTLDAVAGWST